MPYAVKWFDRIRIERLVWSLDQQIYDLPRGQRVAVRREVRANLLDAAHDVGAGEALRHARLAHDRKGASRRSSQREETTAWRQI
jgi:hypothetical protein